MSQPSPSEGVRPVAQPSAAPLLTRLPATPPAPLLGRRLPIMATARRRALRLRLAQDLAALAVIAAWIGLALFWLGWPS